MQTQLERLRARKAALEQREMQRELDELRAQRLSLLQRPAAPRGKGHTIALMGTGLVGINLATRLYMQGYTVLFGARDVESKTAKAAKAALPVGGD